MKTFLLHRNRDFAWDGPAPSNAGDVAGDLGLTTLFAAMAADDRVIATVVPQVVLGGLDDVESVVYRHNVLRDCLANAETVKTLYALAGEAIYNERHGFWSFSARHPSSILRRGREVLPMFFEILKKMRAIAESRQDRFASAGFTRFFTMLRTEIDDAYLATVDGVLRAVEFRDGILMSARLGAGNRGEGYVLRTYVRENRGWLERILPPKDEALTFRVHPRDESGMRALTELGDRGINLVANALAQSADHILAFFTALSAELAFYIGCMNLHGRLTSVKMPVCFPEPLEPGSRRRRVSAIYDPSLALNLEGAVVTNDFDADGKSMIVITGANRGGKSTLLRAIGIAQVMMQAGMFVPAASCRAALCSGFFTHFKREEDSEMQSGKFDEELRRMSAIAEHLSPNALVLFNESFAATNDREGSEVARQISEALLDSGVEVAFVTHLHEFAHRLWEERAGETLFLRAPRGENGERSFRLVEAEPLPTSYGEDVFKRVFR